MTKRKAEVDYKILITTSGIGSRLGELTDYTNKSLVRIGNKPALSLIIENYPSNSEFVITIGHYGEYVKEFLNITYPKHNFTFIEVDNYEGPGSSLGYSILQAKKYLQCPFIFNACDTLLANTAIVSKFLNKISNFCLGGIRKDSSQYATLLVDNKKVKEIKKKGEINFDYAYTGICGIKDYDVFWDILQKIYNKNPNDMTLHEGHIINKMLKQEIDFNFYKTKSWLDMGNVGELEKTRKVFDSFAEVLEKKEESIYFFDDFVVKFFSNSEICKNRIKRYHDLKGLIPEILASGDNFYKYKKVDGDLMANAVDKNNFNNLLQWSKDNLWHTKQIKNFKDLCYNFYIEKSQKRIKKYLDGGCDTESVINGVLVPSVDELFNNIDIDWLCDGIPCGFHGDFILDNILKTEQGFCLLDWRQDFAGNLSVGDLYYDLSKLNHNLTVNHEIVNQKLFDYSKDSCYIMCNSRLLECKQVLRKFIDDSGYDYKKVEVLTAIIWINMAPLHEYPFDKFLFNFGKYNLYKALKNEY